MFDYTNTRFIVLVDGLVVRHGSCSKGDLQHQAHLPGETVHEISFDDDLPVLGQPYDLD